MRGPTASRPFTVARRQNVHTAHCALLAPFLLRVSLLSRSLGILFTTHDGPPAGITQVQGHVTMRDSHIALAVRGA